MNMMPSAAITQKPLRGLFINTAKEQCSIHESGNMALSALLDEPRIRLDYVEIRREDYHSLDSKDFLKKISKDYGTEIDSGSYDFTVVNYHHFTMVPFVGKRQLDGLPGAKYAIVLEVEPHDCLSFCPYGWFDGYIVLDPSVRDDRPEVFAFPRPIEDMLPGNLERVDEIPIIGSFGFGTPGKGFELLVDAVNREFDRALVRINIPSNIYADDAMASVHGENYARYLAKICKRIAKPGIDVEFTYDFMSKDELIEWCGRNTLNCFMYTRKQSGLAATTDQAIASGRPLLVSGNQTFRHIHDYMRPYPGTTLRQAIEHSGHVVKTIQKDWSPQSFRDQFIRMLKLTTGETESKVDVSVSGSGAPQKSKPKPVMLVISPTIIARNAIDTLAARAVSALSDASQFQVIKSVAQTADGYARTCFWLRPEVACFVGWTTDRVQSEIAKFRSAYPDCKIVLLPAPEAGQAEACMQSLALLGADARYILSGIAPFNTQLVAKQPGPAWVGLYGYDAELEAGELGALLAKMEREIGAARVFIYQTRSDDSLTQIALSDRIRMLKRQVSASINFEVKPLPLSAAERIDCLAKNALNIIRYRAGDADTLFDIRDLSLTTERPLVFTRYGKFPGQPDGSVYVEDERLTHFMQAGNGAHIAVFNTLAEGRFVAEVEDLAHKLIAGKDEVPSPSLRDVVNGEGWISLDAKPALLVDLHDDAPREKSATDVTQREIPVEQTWLYDAVRTTIGSRKDARIAVLGDTELQAAASLQKDGVAFEMTSTADIAFVSNVIAGKKDLELKLSQLSRQLNPGGTGLFLCYHAENYQTPFVQEDADFKVVTPEEFDQAMSGDLSLTCILRPAITCRPVCIFPPAFTSPPVGLYVVEKREGI
ncbi:hypothetical protein [Rhizobium sp. FY34]|uniref:hypothetical protein n=1 Tax=Rhizobium sp. FY34 TaxID=2562309 RepID=UPI0010C023D7|nr:hypothetical protein [Rhizobium sp. FY34]